MAPFSARREGNDDDDLLDNHCYQIGLIFSKSLYKHLLFEFHMASCQYL